MASSKGQAMAISATSMEEQWAQMKETIARLLKTSEEKNLQTAAFINRLEAKHGVKAKPSSSPTKMAEEGFDPNACKLMSKDGHDFASSSNPGREAASTVNDKDHDLAKTQKKLEEHDQEEPKPAPQISVFDRLSYSKPRISTLDHVGGQDRISVFKRLSMPTPRSLIPSKMKRQAILEVDTNGPLKIRRRTIIHTGQSSRHQSQKDGAEEMVRDVFPENKEYVTSGSSSPRPLGACSKSSKVERWAHVAPKKLHMKPRSPPQNRQSERGQSNFRQSPERCESVGDSETSTRRSSIPITMCDLFPEDFFNYSVRAPCYEDCEEQLSQIA